MEFKAEGKETLWLIFGLPILTTVIILVSLLVGGTKTPIVNVDAKITATPDVKAVLPQGAITIRNELPATQIHEIINERAVIPDVKITNNVPPGELRLPRGEVIPVEVTNMPKILGVSGNAPPTLRPAVSPEDVTPEGKLLPPPKK